MYEDKHKAVYQRAIQLENDIKASKVENIDLK